MVLEEESQRDERCIRSYLVNPSCFRLTPFHSFSFSTKSTTKKSICLPREQYSGRERFHPGFSPDSVHSDVQADVTNVKGLAVQHQGGGHLTHGLLGGSMKTEPSRFRCKKRRGLYRISSFPNCIRRRGEEGMSLEKEDEEEADHETLAYMESQDDRSFSRNIKGPFSSFTNTEGLKRVKILADLSTRVVNTMPAEVLTLRAFF
jgi:hypothetical protein